MIEINSNTRIRRPDWSSSLPAGGTGAEQRSALNQSCREGLARYFPISTLFYSFRQSSLLTDIELHRENSISDPDKDKEPIKVNYLTSDNIVTTAFNFKFGQYLVIA